MVMAVLWQLEHLLRAARLIDDDLARTADGSLRIQTGDDLTLHVQRDAERYPILLAHETDEDDWPLNEISAEQRDGLLKDLATEVVWVEVSRVLWGLDVVWPMCPQHPTSHLDICSGVWYCGSQTYHGRAHDQAEVGKLVGASSMSRSLWLANKPGLEEWYAEAAEAGNTDAMYKLGMLLKDSDPTRAEEWWTRAADGGNTDAMYNLGVLLKDSDPARAREWWKKVARGRDSG
jgi:hypothetical protein